MRLGIVAGTTGIWRPTASSEVGTTKAWEADLQSSDEALADIPITFIQTYVYKT